MAACEVPLAAPIRVRPRTCTSQARQRLCDLTHGGLLMPIESLGSLSSENAPEQAHSRAVVSVLGDCVIKAVAAPSKGCLTPS